MKNLLIICLLSLFSNFTFSQGKPIFPPKLNTIYQVFDLVHRMLYSETPQAAEVYIKAILSNDFFTAVDRKNLNKNGKQILASLKEVKLLDKGYDFEYCWLPIEANQTDSTISWYNKLQTQTSSLSTKFENGNLRLTSLNIRLETEEKIKNPMARIACDNRHYSVIVLGKRKLLDKSFIFEINSNVLANSDYEDYWQLAKLLEKKNDSFLISYAGNKKKWVPTLLPLEMKNIDFVYILENNKMNRYRANAANGENVIITYPKLDRPVNIAELFFKINTFNEEDYKDILFIGL